MTKSAPVAEKMRKYREKVGASQRQMAIRANCDLRIIEILENGGVTHPNIAKRVAAAYKLGKRDAEKLHPTAKQHEEAVAESIRYAERYGHMDKL